MNLPENSDAVCWQRVAGIFGFQSQVVTGFQKSSSELGRSPEFAESLFGFLTQTQQCHGSLRSPTARLDSVAGFIEFSKPC